MLRVSCLVVFTLLAANSTISKAADLPSGKETTNSLGMNLVRIEPGQFMMGTGDAPPRTRDEWLTRDEDEAPAHSVSITRPCFMGAFEVTNRQYEQFDPEHRKLRGAKPDDKNDHEPVTNVTWQQAVDFCNWLTNKESQPYRLPTEAEWEFACRAGSTAPFHTGETLTADQANFGGVDKNGKPIGVRPVGSFAPNAWGLHDMHGNVAEWCLDWHGPYVSGEQSDPTGRAEGHARIVRGWSWLGAGAQGGARFCRAANRAGLLPEDANRYTGFRVVIGELPSTPPLPVAELPLHQRNVQQSRPPKSKHDPAKPLFIDYTAQKANPTIPPDSWGPIFSKHNHFSSVCVCPNGDVMAVWYTCSGEADRQLSQAASRLRAGSDRWEPASFFFGTPDVNTHAPVLLRHGSRIFHFCTQSFKGWDDSSNVMRTSDDSGATWSKPQIILSRNDPRHLSQPCSAVVTDDGAILLACDGDSHKLERMMVSRDQGATWIVAPGDFSQACGGKYAIHPAIAPCSNGAILCFLRGPDPMPLLRSSNHGDSWDFSSTPFPGIGIGAKAAALRLASGSLLLLTFDRTKRLGGSTIAALSLDDGTTWPHVRKVPAQVGGYTSLAQGDDGVVYLIGSQMKFSACNEAWLREGEPWPK